MTGHDLQRDEPVLVPYGAVSYVDYPGAPPCYELTASNGLASGNSLEEAICHALCELIERDAMTIHEVAVERLGKPMKVLGTSIVDKFGGEVTLADLTTDIGIPTVRASTGDSHGFGTHPDAEAALIRAVTECAQARALGVRTPRKSSPHQTVTDLPTYPSDDLVADIRLVLDHLAKAGLDRAIVVDLSPPEIPAHVVRVLVPGLESWAIDRSKIGERATRAWNETTRAIS